MINWKREQFLCDLTTETSPTLYNNYRPTLPVACRILRVLFTLVYTSAVKITARFLVALAHVYPLLKTGALPTNYAKAEFNVQGRLALSLVPESLLLLSSPYSSTRR